MILSASEARALTTKVLAFSKADSCIVSLAGHARGNIRFALNTVTTSGYQDDLVVSIESHFGQRSGSVSLNELDDASLRAAVRKSEEIARLAPPNEEFQPPLGAQKYLESRVYWAGTAGAGAEKLAALCRPAVREAEARGVTSAGFLTSGADGSAMATSNGLFLHENSTLASFTLSSRTHDGTGSGWVGGEQHDISRLDTAHLAKVAVQKTLDSRNPVALEPGKYTVLLEPTAVCDLLGMLLFALDTRSADEGRSFFTRKGGGNKLGEKLFGDKVTIFSDPQHPSAPGSVYSTDGLPAVRRSWIEGGVLKELNCSRYWAKKTNREPVPFPTNVIMNGGNTSREEMIKSTKRGILVTRFWYIREVDPRTLLLTGLTRDGTFRIAHGKIVRPVKNFRFNESPVALLNNLEAMGPSERTIGSESQFCPVWLPPLLVKDFTFSSLSDAV